MKNVIIAIGLLVGLFSLKNAEANLLTLDNDGTPSFQQTQSNPCIVGGPSCKQPALFLFTDVSAADQDGTVTLAEGTSPTYTRAQVIAAVGGNTFSVGIDTNQAVQTGITLTEFDMFINGILVDQFTQDTLINLINGNGFSDAVLTNFTSLSGGLATDTITFQVSYTGATDGVESFFLIRADAPPCTVNCFPEVPEPSALILMGAGLVFIPVVTRRLFRSRKLEE